MPATSSSSYVIISVVLRRSSTEIVPHHHHHAVVLQELCYFTIARWIEEVKASSSRTCVERGGAVHSVLDQKDRDQDRETIRDLIARWIVMGSQDGS